MRFRPDELILRDGRREPVERAVLETHDGARLPVVRLRGHTGGVPVVFLAGGPGEPGIDVARGRRFALLDALRAVGDVYVYDACGCGDAEPGGACPEGWRADDATPLRREAMLALAMERSRACAQRLRAAGVAPARFNTLAHARHVAELVEAIAREAAPRGRPATAPGGSRRWGTAACGRGRGDAAACAHLVGHSWGTHLAMAVARRSPQLVASLVLAGPEGPDHTWKLPSTIQAQLERIERRAAAAGAAGGRGFVDRLARVVRRLGDSPRWVELDLPGARRRVRLGGFDVELVAAMGLADVRVIARLPSWIDALERDACDRLGGVLARYAWHARTGLGRSAMSLCTDCASGASAGRLRRILREAPACVLGRTIDFPFPEVCEAWGVPDLGDAFRAPLRFDGDAMLITGEWDCRTPHANAEELAPGLRRAVHVRVASAGHMDLLTAPGIAGRIVAFLRGDRVDATPIAAPPVAFVDAADPS